MKQASRSTAWVLLATTLWLVSSRSSAEIIPKKSWAVIGYEAFHKDYNAAKRTPKAIVKKQGKLLTDQESTKSRLGHATKTIIGMGVATAIGKALAVETRPERA